MDLNFYVHKDDDAVECNIHCKQKYKDQILKNQAIVDDIRKCTKSDIQNGKKTITLARLQTLVRGVDDETN